uniref:Uncharacterized protein n=1 Tax=Arundo donax TaxID=35708 RepID=A0A0A9BTQ6_ARUDO
MSTGMGPHSHPQRPIWQTLGEALPCHPESS